MDIEPPAGQVARVLYIFDRVDKLMAQLEVKDQNNSKHQYSYDRTNNPFVTVHSPWHWSQNFLASANILINPMKLGKREKKFD